MSHSQESLSGKDLIEQSEENWVPARAQSGHEGDEQSGENGVTAMAETSPEHEEQSVAGQTFYMTCSFQEGVGCRMPKGCQVVKRDTEH